jgi:hypothetical protein
MAELTTPAVQSESLKKMLAWIEEDDFSGFNAAWDDFSGGAENPDLRDIILAAIAAGRVDILELLIEKLTIEMVIALVPDALALAVAMGRPAIVKKLVKKGWLRARVRKNSRFLSKADAYGNLPVPPALAAYRNMGGQAFALLFFGGQSMVLMAGAGGGGLRALFADMGGEIEASGIDRLASMDSKGAAAFCRDYAAAAMEDSFQVQSAIDIPDGGAEWEGGGAGSSGVACVVDLGDVTMADAGYFPLHEAIRDGDYATITACIKAGFNVDARDDLGQTPLMAAAESGDLKATEKLLEAGADPMLVDERGKSAMAISRTLGAEAQETAMTHAAVSQELEREAGRRQSQSTTIQRTASSSTERGRG